MKGARAPFGETTGVLLSGCSSDRAGSEYLIQSLSGSRSSYCFKDSTDPAQRDSGDLLPSVRRYVYMIVRNPRRQGTQTLVPNCKEGLGRLRINPLAEI